MSMRFFLVCIPVETGDCYDSVYTANCLENWLSTFSNEKTILQAFASESLEDMFPLYYNHINKSKYSTTSECVTRLQRVKATLWKHIYFPIFTYIVINNNFCTL